MAEVPIRPRKTCALGDTTDNPWDRSFRRYIHTKMTGIAKKDIKNTVCHGGIVSDTCFTSDDITMNDATAKSFKRMPVIGCMVMS